MKEQRKMRGKGANENLGGRRKEKVQLGEREIHQEVEERWERSETIKERELDLELWREREAESWGEMETDETVGSNIGEEGGEEKWWQSFTALITIKQSNQSQLAFEIKLVGDGAGEVMCVGKWLWPWGGAGGVF